MKLGAHVSTSGGISTALDRAKELGAETIQIFASTPRAWRFNSPSEDQVLAFREKSESTGIAPAFIHASYLISIGSPDEELVSKSKDVLTKTMQVGAQIGAAAVIFHPGSHRGAGLDAVLPQFAAAVQEVLSQSPADVQLALENSAGMGGHIGSSFGELARLIDAIGSEQVSVCLDTQHSFAAGYNIADPDSIDAVVQEFDSEVGLSRLVAVHANDSKRALGDGVDRHENIGAGHIGTAGFETTMSHDAFRDVPFLLEVPGDDYKGSPDKPNLDRLKEIRSRLGVPA